MAKPHWLKDRKTKKRPFPPHKLKRGWRWLRVGEWAEIGDFCCDPRIMPVKLTDGGWCMTKQHHPVQTSRSLKGFEKSPIVKAIRYKEEED